MAGPTRLPRVRPSASTPSTHHQPKGTRTLLKPASLISFETVPYQI